MSINNCICNDLNLTIYFEYEKNSNPYYVQNKGLENATLLIEQLHKSNNKEVLLKNDDGETLNISKLQILSFRGKNRAELKNDCEIDVVLRCENVINNDIVLKFMSEYCKKYNAKINKTGEHKNDT